MRNFWFLVLSFVFIPTGISAQVIISEIAWMGTEVSHHDEWIELYNDSDTLISLEGWVLSAGDGTPSITLSGTIPARGTYILERTDDSSVPSVSANAIYTGALENGGETLSLTENGNVVYTLNASSGWVAGDNDTKETMQWNGDAWITSSPTPGVYVRMQEEVSVVEESSQNELSIETQIPEEVDLEKVVVPDEEIPTVAEVVEEVISNTEDVQGEDEEIIPEPVADNEEIFIKEKVQVTQKESKKAEVTLERDDIGATVTHEDQVALAATVEIAQPLSIWQRMLDIPARIFSFLKQLLSFS